MSTDTLALLVRRAMTDAEFLRRATADPDRTLAAEAFVLSPSEREAVRDFHREIVGFSAADVHARLAGANRRQGW